MPGDFCLILDMVIEAKAQFIGNVVVYIDKYM